MYLKKERKNNNLNNVGDCICFFLVSVNFGVTGSGGYLFFIFLGGFSYCVLFFECVILRGMIIFCVIWFIKIN